MRCPKAVVAIVLSSLMLSSPALAQQRHVVSSADMRQAITNQAQARQQTRDALRGVLKHSDVRAAAERLGVNVTKAESAVATLTAAELDQLAAPVRQVSADLSGGGNTVVISTTTLLLIIIIIILVAD